jgi:3'(2'), 5'-bisphosphate nucleotidase
MRVVEAHAVAMRVAAAAGRLLVELRAAGHDRGTLRARGDRESNRLILAELDAAYPGEPVLSEESPDDGSRRGAPRVWIVDPLDGTSEFGVPGRSDWAVHVALVMGERAVAGAVALPARGLVLGSAAPPPPPPTGPPTPRVVVSRSRPPAVAEAVRAALGGRLVPLGSAGAKAMAVVLGEAEVYVHAGGLHEWDSAAPAAVAAAAGLHVSALDGAPLRFNRPHPWHSDLLICRRDLAPAVLAAARG